MNDKSEEVIEDGPLDARCNTSDLLPRQVEKFREIYKELVIPNGRLRTAAGQEVAFRLKYKTTENGEERFDCMRDGNVSIATSACTHCKQINSVRSSDDAPFVCIVQANPTRVNADGTHACLYCKIAHKACDAKGGRLPPPSDRTKKRNRSSLSLLPGNERAVTQAAGRRSWPSQFEARGGLKVDRNGLLEGSYFGSCLTTLGKHPRPGHDEEVGKRVRIQSNSLISSSPPRAPLANQRISITPPPSRPGSDTLQYRRNIVVLPSNTSGGEGQHRHSEGLQRTQRGSQSREVISIGSSEEDEPIASTSKSNVARLHNAASSNNMARKLRLPDSRRPVASADVKKEIDKLKGEKEKMSECLLILREKLANEAEKARAETVESARRIQELEVQLTAARPVSTGRVGAQDLQESFAVSGAHEISLTFRANSNQSDLERACEKQEEDIACLREQMQKNCRIIRELRLMEAKSPTDNRSRKGMSLPSIPTLHGDIISGDLEGTKINLERLRSHRDNLRAHLQEINARQTSVTSELSEVESSLEHNEIEFLEMLNAEIQRMRRLETNP